ncbi:hypothetical protein [Umezawaea sp. Da 62-37]|uniref:hypothetical protein n=1 Tax=Umezawaea sp. Da 62-37 TaxID=3075927 RepID=UPI0028F706B1|nr:hypothetical protein [Umezawaea sp. Da 62-37]WNV84204.1 hypothetical protein RM788_39505 [Umezawaea sp. Da 62-37]
MTVDPLVRDERIADPRHGDHDAFPVVELAAELALELASHDPLFDPRAANRSVRRRNRTVIGKREHARDCRQNAKKHGGRAAVLYA